MESEFEVIIVGGGVAGLALALALTQESQDGVKEMRTEDIVVMEARSREDALDTTAGLQVQPNGMDILRKLGVADKVRESGATVYGMKFLNQDGRKLADIEFQSPEMVTETPVNLPRGTLSKGLLEAVEARKIKVLFEHRVEELIDAIDDEDKATLKMKDGKVYCARRCVCIADGISSRLRKFVLPESEATEPTYTGLVTMGGFLPKKLFEDANCLPHPRRLEMVFGWAGFYGYGPGPDDSIMWWNSIPMSEVAAKEAVSRTGRSASETKEEAEEKDQNFKDLMAEAHKGWEVPPVATTISNATRGKSFVGCIYDMPRLSTWHSGRLVLLGDAAHAVTPHSGQGASMALEDAFILGTCIKCLPSGASKKQAADSFTTFESLRKGRVEKVVEYGRKSSDSKARVGWFGAKLRDFFVWAFLPTIVWKTHAWIYGDVKKW